MYGVVVSIAYPMLLVPYVSLTFDVIGKGWKAAEMRVEYIVVRELFLNSGRIVSVLAFLATVTFFSEEKGIPILLLVLGAGHAVIYFFVRHVQFSKEKGGESYTFARQKGGDGDSSGGTTV
jgi:YQGE family putative transporter